MNELGHNIEVHMKNGIPMDLYMDGKQIAILSGTEVYIRLNNEDITLVTMSVIGKCVEVKEISD